MSELEERNEGSEEEFSRKKSQNRSSSVEHEQSENQSYVYDDGQIRIGIGYDDTGISYLQEVPYFGTGKGEKESMKEHPKSLSRKNKLVRKRNNEILKTAKKLLLEENLKKTSRSKDLEEVINKLEELKTNNFYTKIKKNNKDIHHKVNDIEKSISELNNSI